jgi:hypothetical protein
VNTVQSWIMSEVHATPYPLSAIICGCIGGFVLVQWLAQSIGWSGITGKANPPKSECRKTMARYILIGGVAGVIVYATPWPLAAIAAGLAGPAALTGKLYQPRPAKPSPATVPAIQEINGTHNTVAQGGVSDVGTRPQANGSTASA